MNKIVPNKIQLNQYAAIAVRVSWALALLWGSRFIFYFFNQGSFKDLSMTDWGNIMWGGLRFDIAAICYVNSLYIILQSTPLKARYQQSFQRFTRGLYFFSNGLALLVSCVDMVYFPFTLRRTTASVVREFSNEDNLGTILTTAAWHYWYFLPVFLILFWLLVIGYNRISVKPPAIFRPNYFYTGSLGMLLLFPFLLVGGIRGDWRYSTRPITMSNAGQYVKNPGDIPLVLNTPFCILRTIRQQFYKEDHYFSTKQLADIYSPIIQLNPAHAFKAENVVILVLESFGRESIGFYNRGLNNGRYKGYTPFLDSLLAKSYVVENGFAAGRKSIDALPAVLASISSGELPFVLTPYVSNQLQGLPQLLKEKGYHTSFFHGAPNGSMGFQALVNLLGVEHYYGKDQYGNDQDFDGTWGIWDEPFLQFFASKLDSFPEPFQSTIFTVSSHEPFKVPAKYKDVFPKGEHPIREVTGYTDQALKKFFEKIKTKPWFRKTLFVITADHASISHHPSYQTAWGNMAIPIFFYHPSDSLKAFLPGNIQQTDIMPSVLGYLGYKGSIVSFGKNIFDSQPENWVVNYYGGYQLIQNQFLYQQNENGKSVLFDFIKDPQLHKNLATQEKQVVLDMDRRLKAYIQQYHNRLIGNQLLPPAR
ncbi:MAG: LTA synthase family protein [Bacteroidetes bacterium]|nr:LTA synthase family protein [Bacteroidota bacterium]